MRGEEETGYIHQVQSLCRREVHTGTLYIFIFVRRVMEARMFPATPRTRPLSAAPRTGLASDLIASTTVLLATVYAVRH